MKTWQKILAGIGLATIVIFLIFLFLILTAPGQAPDPAPPQPPPVAAPAPQATEAQTSRSLTPYLWGAGGIIALYFVNRYMGLLLYLIGYAKRIVENDVEVDPQTGALHEIDEEKTTYVYKIDPMLFLCVFSPMVFGGLAALFSPLVSWWGWGYEKWWLFFLGWPVYAALFFAGLYVQRNWTQFVGNDMNGMREGFLFTTIFEKCNVLVIPGLMRLLLMPKAEYDFTTEEDPRSPNALTSFMKQRPLIKVAGAAADEETVDRQSFVLYESFAFDLDHYPSRVFEYFLPYIREDIRLNNHKFTAVKKGGPISDMVVRTSKGRCDESLQTRYVNDITNEIATVNDELTRNLRRDLSLIGIRVILATIGDVDDTRDDGYFHQLARMNTAKRESERLQTAAKAEADARMAEAEQDRIATEKEMETRKANAVQEQLAVQAEVAVARTVAERNMQNLLFELEKLDTEQKRSALVAAKLSEMSAPQIAEFGNILAGAMALNVPDGGNVSLVGIGNEGGNFHPLTQLAQIFMDFYNKKRGP